MRIEVRTAGTASAHPGYAPDVGDWVLGQPPTYSDFTYMAFMVGMAYAMAETEPENTHIRKVVLGHALLSYAFGTGILAVAINLVTNLGQ
jgi:uncharacterized membrane protein